jgi:hypothetical protein
MNTRAADHELKDDELRNAVNVDITPEGKLRRRKDGTLVQSGTDPHSLWSPGPTSENGYYVEGNTLVRAHLGADGTLTKYVLASNMVAGRRCAFLDLDGVVYYSNGAQNGRIVNGVRKAWGVEVPAGFPVAVSVSNGLLQSGAYKVACTFLVGEEEGGVNFVSQGTAVTAGQALQVSAIPQPVSAEVTGIRLYCSKPNGAQLYRIADLAVGTTSFLITTVEDTGKELSTQFMGPPPVGDMLAYYNGRIYIANGPVVAYTEPLGYGLFAWSRNFLLFGEDVTLLASVDDGLYVAADKTFFLSGPTPNEFVRKDILPYGAVKYTASYDTQGDAVSWFSHRGLVVGGPSGQVKNVQEERVGVDRYLDGASFLREAEGLRHVVTVLNRSQMASGLAVSDYAEAEIRRKET